LAELPIFAEELGEVPLVPGTGGVFDIRLNGELVGRGPKPKASLTSKSSSNWCGIELHR
jgi:predicted Rdx family selenoprotein